jgi:hypothetical protein
MKTGSSVQFSQIVDRLGRLQAQITDLEQEEKALKAHLVQRGDGAYEGTLFRATVTSSTRDRLDMCAVRAKLSPQFISAHTATTPYTVVKVVARNGETIREAA